MIDIQKEREAFEAWCYRCDIDISRYNLIGNQRYKDSMVEAYWEGWKASANRQGYKLVPIEPTLEMVEAAEGNNGHIVSIYKDMLEAVK